MQTKLRFSEGHQVDALAQRRRKLILRVPSIVDELRQAGMAEFVQLGEALYIWREEIARPVAVNPRRWHRRLLQLINRQAYGFRSFENQRQRVKV